MEAELAAYRTHEVRPLTPSGILKNNGSETRRAVNEMQDQMKAMRAEMQKKDSLVQHLVSLDSAHKVPRAPDSYRLDSLYLAERGTVDATRSELATISVKYEKACEKLKDSESEIEARDIRIRELEHRVGNSRESEARLSEMVTTLREKLADFESRSDSFETVANRGEYTISTLQKENRELNEKVMELELRLRKQLEEREGAEYQVLSEGRRLHELLKQLSSVLYTDEIVDTTQESTDLIMRKLTDIIQENATLKGTILTMKEHLSENHLETKASRETIMRLVSEVGREQKMATRFTSEVEMIRQERDNALASKHDLMREIELLRDRLDAGQKTIDATKEELILVNNRFSNMDRNYRETSHTVHVSGTALKLFREQLANVLSAVFNDVTPSEECIKDCIIRLSKDKREVDLRIEQNQIQMKALTEQLENELGIHRDMAQRAKRFEVENVDLMERLRMAEGELASGDVLRDGFKFDKEKYLRGLQRLGEVMKMDRISLDLGLDLTMDALVARAEQLIKLETNCLAEKSSHVYNLQRKLKALKEQLESKDLHIDLLRKKMTSLEERLHGKCDVDRLRDTDVLRIEKLEKLIEKYKLQLQDSRHEVQNLKAQLLGSGELKVRTLEQRKDIEELAKQVEELEEIRKRQGHKIGELKHGLSETEGTFQDRSVASENAVQALSSELRTTKNALDKLKYNEKQLLDFRTVVARMLGLDINTLAVPDYEIISRLEKLIEAHHSTTFATLSLEEALHDVQDGTSDSYRTIVTGTDTVIARSRDRTRRKARSLRTRARSLSPMKRDPRQY